MFILGSVSVVYQYQSLDVIELDEWLTSGKVAM